MLQEFLISQDLDAVRPTKGGHCDGPEVTVERAEHLRAARDRRHDYRVVFRIVRHNQWDVCGQRNDDGEFVHSGDESANPALVELV